MPRTFRLYDELEKAEHAKLSDQSVSYGLDKGKYEQLNYFKFEWQIKWLITQIEIVLTW